MSWTLLFGVLALMLFVAVFFLLRQQGSQQQTDAKLGVLKEEWSKRLAEELEKVWRQIQMQVQTTDQSVSQKLEETQRTFADIKEQLGSLKEATDQVESVGRNVSSLQELLRAPKMRGGFGEFFLADLLAQILPSDFYALQYEFSGGERVDAIIRLQERLVPIDAKFPLEQFRRMGEAATEAEQAQWRKGLLADVKQHIDAIAQKYIRPSEGTFDFALMYIPAENVYYEAVIKGDGVSDEKGVFQHAVKRQVIPVSPNSFYAYLQVILLGLRGLTVEERAKDILAGLIRLQQELSGVREDFDKAGKQLRYAADNFGKAERHLERFQDRLVAIEAPPSDLPAEKLLQEDAKAVKEVE